MGISAIAERTLREEAVRDERVGQDRVAHITMHKDESRALLDLSWHTGVNGMQRGRRVVKILERGKKIAIGLDRAISFFGPFMIPRDMEGETDEVRLREAQEHFREERMRALMTWGDYPRHNKLSDGIEPIGPHRFPHVIITIEDGDGTRSEPFDLHQIYEIGEYDVPDLRPSHFAGQRFDPTAALAEKEREVASLTSIVMQMKGQLELLTAQSIGNAPGAPKAAK